MPIVKEKKMSKALTYEEFGAIGNGIADDMPAIVACHEAANKEGLPVVAKSGATYYIGARDLTATIKTDTDFNNAKFIIDDRTLENIKTSLFNVAPDSEPFTPEITSLYRNQKKIDFPHTGNVYVQIETSSHKIYIRKGLNQNAGNDPSDCFIVDAEGNIKNELNWDYPAVSNIYAISADDKPITIKGGVFTTVANRAPSKYTYHRRNFNITRSNVTIDSLTHYIVGELDHGAPYEGFISVNRCWNFTAKNLLLTPHFTYWTESKIPGKDVPMGTYDFSFGAAINARLIGIRQTIDINDGRYWGLMGSNFSKELHLEDCIMSRFDAHCGVTNGSIKNCVLGHAGLNLIGFGKFLIENTTVRSNTLVNFRQDYGSFFHGELTIKNCKWMPQNETSSTVLNAYNTQDHDFGYKCGLPETIIIDGLEVTLKDGYKSDKLYILPDYDHDFSEDKPYRYGTPETVSLSKITVNRDVELELAKNCEQYLETQAVCP